MKRIVTFIVKTSMREKMYFFEALTYLYFYKLYLIFVPYKKWAIKNQSQKSENNLNLNQIKLLRKSIYRANKLTFFRNECLVLSLASKKILQKRDIHSILNLGLLKDEFQKLQAHAWLIIPMGNNLDFEFIPNTKDYKTIFF